MKKLKTYRQGDVLLVRVDQRPEGLTKIQSKGRIILAYGEATGHHHSIDSVDCQEFVDGTGVTWIECRQAVELLHQEHSPVRLPRGVYRKIQQLEYTPAEIRRVVD